MGGKCLKYNYAIILIFRIITKLSFYILYNKNGHRSYGCTK